MIKNGTVVDGTGRQAFRGDVAIRGGKIVDAKSAKPGSRVIDAEGKVVAPGFVDVHTHYDAQLMWDPLCSCSPWHGVTTVVMGNCGFTLAPVHPKDRENIIGMFARVEGMSHNALRLGLDWRWQTFSEFLRRIQEQKLGINVATMVGHSTIRRFVMGDAASHRQAEADEVQQMKALVREAIAAGAFGFTTSLSATHYGWDGAPGPSRLATNEEVIELASALSGFGVGSTEIITKSAVRGKEFTQEDQELMMTLARRTGRPVNWNELQQNYDRPGVWRTQIEFMERAAKLGAPVYAIARCQRLDRMFNLRIPQTFDRWPTWLEGISKPREEEMKLLRDPQVRAAMKSEADAAEARTPDYRKLERVILNKSKTGKHAQDEKKTLAEISKATGKHIVDVLIDLSLDENLETEFAYIGMANGDEEAVAQIVTSPYALAGISDAGAHTDRLSGSYFSTYMLTHWVRDTGTVTLEDGVRRLTSMPASVYGIRDRGILREGLAGDVVIFDMQKLNWLPAERFKDFPGGEERLGNRAEGYEHLIVDGETVFEHGKPTGASPGRLIKSSEFGG